MILKPFKVHSPDGKKFYEGDATQSHIGEDAANGVITRDEAIRMVKEYARSLKDERNDQTAMRFWHIVNLLSGGYAQAPSAGKVAAEPVAERTERPFNQGPYGAFTPTSEGTEKAREFLIGYMRSGMGNGIYDNFIRYELASDFAWNLANGLNALTAEKVAGQVVDSAIVDCDIDMARAVRAATHEVSLDPYIGAPQPAQTQVALTEGDGQ